MFKHSIVRIVFCTVCHIEIVLNVCGTTAEMESLLLDNPSGLPPIWDVLYYEGIRGNHILFSQSDVKMFEASGKHQGSKETMWSPATLSDVVYDLLSQGSVSDMKIFISLQPKSIRAAVYRLYSRWLEAWGLELKKSLS